MWALGSWPGRAHRARLPLSWLCSGKSGALSLFPALTQHHSLSPRCRLWRSVCEGTPVWSRVGREHLEGISEFASCCLCFLGLASAPLCRKPCQGFSGGSQHLKFVLFSPALQYYEMSYGLNIEMHKQVGGKTSPSPAIPGEGGLSALSCPLSLQLPFRS